MKRIENASLQSITTKIGSGATPRGGKDAYKDSGISLIRSLNVYDFEFSYDNLAFIDDTQAAALKGVEVYPDDILLNITGASVCRCCLVPKDVLPARVNQHVAIIRLNQDVADPRYVLYTINSPAFKDALLKISMTGATREALTKDDISRFEIPLPELVAQKKIAAILSAYDDLIDNNKRRIALLERMAEEIYREWFVRLRFPGHEGVKVVKGVPEGWEVGKLPELAKITYGFPFQSSRFNTLGIGKPIIRIRNIVESATTDYTDEVPDDKYIVQHGDIVVGMDGEFHINHWQGDEAYLVQRVCRIKALDPQIEGYLFKAIHAPIKHFQSILMGATVGHLGAMHLNEIQILIPPPDLQAELVRFNEIFKQKLKLSQAIRLLMRTRDLLLPRLISGRLSVEDLDIRFPASMEAEAPVEAEAVEG